MIKIIILSSILSFFVSCSITSPGYNESNVEYTIILTADNQVGDSIFAISSSDTSTVLKNRTYVWKKSFSWTEEDKDDDNATMTTSAVMYLSDTISFYNFNDSLILKYAITPSKVANENINSVCFEHFNIVVK